MSRVPYLRGWWLFESDRIERFRYLLVRSVGDVWTSRQRAKAKRLKAAGLAVDDAKALAHSKSDPRPVDFDQLHPSCLFSVYADPASRFKWAPRDSLEHASSSLAEWRSHGYGSYEMLLSLIGTNADQKALLNANKFVFVGYSYLHLSFDRFISVLRRMDPADRFFCFMIPLGVPVHMYFDIDGDFGEFPDLVDQDEACLNAFLEDVKVLFFDLFGRSMDCSGLTLLQATSATKLSWHLHVQTEAFRDVHHMKQFVLRLNERLAAKTGSSTSILMNASGKSLVDPAPYMDRQNFRAPYCCKPGKMALLPRTFVRKVFTDSGVIRLDAARPAAELHANIDEELLWRCHPALAQPGPGYTYLELAPVESGKGQKRKTDEDVLTTSNRARKLAGVLDAASASSRATVPKMPKGAVPESCRLLSQEEEVVVRMTLVPILGSAVELDTCNWYRTTFRSEATVSGVCAAGTARCISQSELGGTSAIHRKNRMAFTLQAGGTILVRCFKCDSGKVGHRYDWQMNDAERQLLALSCGEVERAESASAVLSLVPELAVVIPSAIVESVVVAPSGVVPAVAAPTMSVHDRLIQFIQSKVSAARLASLFHRGERSTAATAISELSPEEQRMRDLFKQIVFDGHDRDDSLQIGKDELYERFCSFKNQADIVQAERSMAWRKVVRVCERFLDPSQTAIASVFDQFTHVALLSGQGTNKTGLIFAMVLVWILRNPQLRVLILSNRKTYASTVQERSAEFDRTISSVFGTQLGFRSYTEESFRPPSRKTALGEERDDHKKAEFDRAMNAANRRLAAAPRMILSIQSLGRLFASTDEFGTPTVPYYDVIIPDEFMELLAIFHGTTMDEKRRLTLERWTSLMTRAKRVCVADADLNDDTALPLLRGLTGGKSFVKLENTAKTIKRQYLKYSKHAQWRLALVQAIASRKKTLVACNTKAEVLSIINDPEIKRLVVELGLRVKGLHADSPAEDRKAYIDSVRSWSELDLLVFSPTISHGVNFDETHFDMAFQYASDNSTKACQTFQQLNRARQISSNQVHVFINAHPKRFAHLPCGYDELKAELNEEVRRSHGDWFVKNLHGNSRYRRQLGVAQGVVLLPVMRSEIPRHGHAESVDEVEADREVSRRYRAGLYTLDTQVDPVSCVRVLFDSLSNELYLRNQLAINRSCVNFEKLLVQQFESAGGVMVTVKEQTADQARVMQQAKAIKIADGDRKAAELQAIVGAPDIRTAEEVKVLRQRRQFHLLKEGELEQLLKAEWKERYGIDLLDTRRVRDVVDFASRFGSEQRMQQSRRLQALRSSLPPVIVSAESDPIPYLSKETQSRAHCEMVLQSAGFASCFDDRVIVATDQQAFLEPGQVGRKAIIERWESERLERKGWWLSCLKKQGWAVRETDLRSTAKDEPVSGSDLFRVLLSGCRQFLASKFGIKIASGRSRVSGERTYIYQLDRTHWNEFSKGLLDLPPQVLDVRMAGGKKGEKRVSSQSERESSDCGDASMGSEPSLQELNDSQCSADISMDVDSEAFAPPAAEESETSESLLEGLSERQAAIIRRLSVASASGDSEDEDWVSPSMLRVLARSMRLSTM